MVAVTSVSYGSYLLLRVTHGRNGVLLSALLGGAYSSTVTTIAPRPSLGVGTAAPPIFRFVLLSSLALAGLTPLIYLLR
jgi:uncharacterized membrane protein (DUF4010 family)